MRRGAPPRSGVLDRSSPPEQKGPMAGEISEGTDRTRRTGRSTLAKVENRISRSGRGRAALVRREARRGGRRQLIAAKKRRLARTFVHGSQRYPRELSVGLHGEDFRDWHATCRRGALARMEAVETKTEERAGRERPVPSVDHWGTRPPCVEVYIDPASHRSGGWNDEVSCVGGDTVRPGRLPDDAATREPSRPLWWIGWERAIGPLAGCVLQTTEPARLVIASEHISRSIDGETCDSAEVR